MSLKKRIIFTLLFDDGWFVLSRNFKHQRVGDIKWLKNNYNFSTIIPFIDELIILNISENKNRELFIHHLKELAKECFIPISVGGGILDLKYAEELFSSGADKVVINSCLKFNPTLIREIACAYGAQAIVASVDIKSTNNGYSIWINNGTQMIEEKPEIFMKYLTKQQIGEIYLNSINRDGTGDGYDFDLLKLLPKNNKIPIIMAGGAGNFKHFSEGLKNKNIDAVATAHLFNFIGNGLENARKKLIKERFDLPIWETI
jgi:imidazole glycerol-phosphate synthase subunit HisF